MDIYSELGIQKYINAHDTYTLYGGSRMSEKVLAAMSEAAQHYVDINELQDVIGRKVAELTGNEAAYLTSGSCAGILLATVVCLSGDDEEVFASLPKCHSKRNQFIVIKGQKNPFWSAIADAGASIIEIGDEKYADENDLRQAISDKTAGIFYFAEKELIERTIPFCEITRIAKETGIPVVVDAASQLPPADNLNHYTKKGADMVIFSGGKSLAGPQCSGFIVGKQEMIERCKQYGFPRLGICRPCKIGKEEMVGLLTAIKLFVDLDQDKRFESLKKTCFKIAQLMEETGVIHPEVVSYGPVGQRFPMVYGYFTNGSPPEKMKEMMKKDGIFIGTTENAFFINPSDLTPVETTTVMEALIRNVNLIR